MLWFLSHTKQLPPKMLEIWGNLTDSWYPNLKHYFACHQMLLPDTKPPNTTKPTEKQLHLKKADSKLSNRPVTNAVQVENTMEIWPQAVHQSCHKSRTSWKQHASLTPGCPLKLSQVHQTCKAQWNPLHEPGQNPPEPEVSKNVANSFVGFLTLPRLKKMQTAI